MKISLVTPTKNSADLLESCIEAVRAQEYPNLEYIIVDGASDDGTRDIVEKNRDIVSHFICEPDEGMYDALNKGFELATGEVLCWINSDDHYFPNCLKVVNEVFSRFPDVNWMSGYQAANADGVVTGVSDAFFPREIIRMGLCNGRILRHVTQEATFWRKECWETCGPFPSHIKFAGDFWLWRRFSEKWEMVFVEALLGSFTRREGQFSQLHDKEYKDEVKKIVDEEVKEESLANLRLLSRVSRFWHLLRWIPKAKGLVLKRLGNDAVSAPVISLTRRFGWWKRQVFIWERESMLDYLFRRFRRR